MGWEGRIVILQPVPGKEYGVGLSIEVSGEWDRRASRSQRQKLGRLGPFPSHWNVSAEMLA